MKQMEFLILEQSYKLACPDGEESHLTQAVHKVDAAMRQIRDAGKIKARERIAVLAALNLAYEPPLQNNDNQPAPPSTVVLGESAQVQALIDRIDNVLGVDGQLL